MEQKVERFNFENYFDGDLDLFKEAFGKRETKIFFDADGILVDTPKVVLEKFSRRHNVNARPEEINGWNFLTERAKEIGLGEKEVSEAEGDWYDPEVLIKAPRYLFMGPAVQRIVNFHGIENSFVLTSREPFLKESTERSIKDLYPPLPPQNILIRDDDKEKPTIFKARKIGELIGRAPWVILIEDSTKYVKFVLENAPENVLVINIPLGLIQPDFKHKRMILMGRYPSNIQAMYPFFYIVKNSQRLEK